MSSSRERNPSETSINNKKPNWNAAFHNKPTMESISGFILAGGASSRMGTDKARLTLEGKTFIELIAEEISQVASVITVVSNDPRLDTGLPTVRDIYEHWGALGGVHAALVACRSPWALVVACDLPLVKAPLFNHLAGLRDDFEAVAPIQRDGRPQPLCAFYRVGPGLVTAAQLIKSGERRPIALLQSIRTRWVTFAEIEDLAGADRFFDNINTPQDYARIDERSQ